MKKPCLRRIGLSKPVEGEQEKVHERGDMNKESRSELFMLPNILTSFRILLVPVFIWALLQEKPFEAFLIFLLAGLTDVLDGLAARLRNQKSRLGLWLDPAADKLLLTSAFILLSVVRINHPNVIPAWLTWVVVGRDVIITLAAFVLLRWRGRKAFLPSILGKTSTVCQVLTVSGVLILNILDVSSVVLNWLYDATLIATVISGLHYAHLVLPDAFRGKGR